MATTFEVWAPLAREQVQVEVDGSAVPMTGSDDGWWRARVDQATHGTPYSFRLDGGDPRPDPRSRWQPEGVPGPSAVYDHGRFSWTDQGWRGTPLPGAVIYELHVGTFTPDGTLQSAVDRLDHLAALGVTLIELLPLAAFPGHHGWGYDGVGLYAVHQAYGGPDGLKTFVDACHARGIGVCLDVVYNHLGPAHNYLSEFGPYFTHKYATPWGQAVNLDDPGSDEVRRFIVGNALGWFRDFHVDALRLDAVHALHDERAVPILEELSQQVDAAAATLGRPLWLIAESDRNDPRTVTPRESGGLGIHAQWDDDVHHALHALLTGERDGYYGDFGSLPCLAKTMTRAFFHDGTWSSFRGRVHGRPVDVEHTAGWRFVAALQNHDQIGNRAAGDRLSATLSDDQLAVAAGLLLTSPYTPMLFMGEEWGAGTPWQYFTDFADPDLAEAVRNGRRNEFADHGWNPEDVPDPQDEGTFRASRLDWNEPEKETGARLLDWYTTLIRLRRELPGLADPRLYRVEVTYDEDARWVMIRRGDLGVVANLAGAPATVPLGAVVDETAGRDGVVLAWHPDDTHTAPGSHPSSYPSPTSDANSADKDDVTQIQLPGHSLAIVGLRP
ncbi:malto-oligosyltrehalose trehalohydrolase [Actinopolymorpha singaporensis]|uniref:Malto-oligosyltrehalose trehalohydrolase n=1 Tax=Actinopolymorpha singaporensis TaxID=117157 RepID=A0A1H1WSP9_9ACTN|nr:malto-oligosyltrehalose trehalohydrolase [Actinopolymorpha singaporensis]SDT00094.1 maltooligosyl trehalose hydrolase [Actinopolymorpha singaporensis]